MPRDIKLPLPLVICLILGLVHGSIYVWLMPPWQHYDEPTHFEVAWLIADRLRLPRAGDFDPEMRRQVAESMIKADFFRGLGYLPDLDPPDGRVWIGDYIQLDEPPLYYLLTVIPLRLFNDQPIESQLFAARLVSVTLLLVSIAACYGLVSELTPPGSIYRWLVPGSVALLPGFVEMMSSVNNDVGAAAGMSVALWGSTRLVRRGFSWWTALWSGAAAIICLFMKETSYVALPIWGVALLFGLFRHGWWRRSAWIVLGVGVVGVLLGVVGWGDALWWYRATDQPAITRLETSNAPVGEAVFRLQLEHANQSGGGVYQLNQLLPPDMVEELRGKKVTIGVWMWADAPVQILLPVLTSLNLDRGANQSQQQVEIGTQPSFYAYYAAVPDNSASLRIQVNSQVPGGSGNLYLDGLVMATGEFPLAEAPTWDDASAVSGNWGGRAFSNLIRNGSAEVSGPRFYPWVDRLGMRVLPDNGRPSLLLYSILDTRAARGYNTATAKNMLQSFWGRFGWGHVLLDGNYVYRILAFVTIIGLVGSLAALWNRDSYLRFTAIIVLGLAVAIGWGLAFVRGAFNLFNWSFIPGARYAFPVVNPSMGWLCFGWWSIISPLLRIPGIKKALLLGGMAIGFLVLDVWSVVSILRYYAG